MRLGPRFADKATSPCNTVRQANNGKSPAFVSDMPGFCWQAFGALTHALTTTIKNNTTGRPLSNVEVVSSVRLLCCQLSFCRLCSTHPSWRHPVPSKCLTCDSAHNTCVLAGPALPGCRRLPAEPVPQLLRAQRQRLLYHLSRLPQHNSTECRASSSILFG